MSNLISFRIDPEKKAVLDAIASGQDRDRSYVINEAVDRYLEVYQWQVAYIQKGVEQANRGEFASDEEVKAAFAKWRK